METELTFLVNGEEELTAAEFEEKYGEAGYSVEFKYDFENGPDDGVVTVTSDFKYAVQVTDPEGNLIPAELTPEHFVDVKVKDPSVAVEVTEAGLVDWDLDYITTTDDGFKIAAETAVNAFGEEVDALPDVIKVTSSDPTIAYYDIRDGITALEVGNVTFTVEFEGIEDTVDVPVEIKEGQKMTSVELDETPIKVEASKSATISFTVLDQYGEPMRSNTAYYTVTAEGSDESDTVTEITLNSGKGTITGTWTAGKYIVNIYDDDKKTNKIDSFTFEAVDVTQSDIADEYRLVFADKDKTEIDLKITDTLTINIEAYVDGVKVSNVSSYLTDFKAVSTNTDVATAKLNDDSTITVTGESVGTTTIKLVTVEGDLVTTYATLDVTVVNTTPQITELSFKQDIVAVGSTAGTSTNAIEADDIVAALTAGKDADGNEIFSAEMIDTNSIAFIEPEVNAEGNVEGRVVFSVKDVYGGESFVFPAVITPADAGEVTYAGPGDPNNQNVFDDITNSVDFSAAGASDLHDWTSVEDGYYAISLNVANVTLSEEEVDLAIRVYEDGSMEYAEVKGTLDVQYVTTKWKTGEADMYYILNNGEIYTTTINVVDLTPPQP